MESCWRTSLAITIYSCCSLMKKVYSGFSFNWQTKLVVMSHADCVDGKTKRKTTKTARRHFPILMRPISIDWTVQTTYKYQKIIFKNIFRKRRFLKFKKLILIWEWPIRLNRLFYAKTAVLRKQKCLTRDEKQWNKYL